MASSDTVEEKTNGNVEEAGEQEPCMGETDAQRPYTIGRETSVTRRARQYARQRWQQLRRLLAFDILYSM